MNFVLVYDEDNNLSVIRDIVHYKKTKDKLVFIPRNSTKWYVRPLGYCLLIMVPDEWEFRFNDYKFVFIQRGDRNIYITVERTLFKEGEMNDLITALKLIEGKYVT